MDVDGFWSFVERARSPTALHAQLATLSADELVSFEKHHNEAFYRSYDWALWGAAYLIDGGCSDDGFDYFRAYLISLGRVVYEDAVVDPDSLADVEIDDAEGWEDWMYPTMKVIHDRTGRYALAGDLDPELRLASREPAGQSWEEADLPARFPRLATKYGWVSQ